MYMRVHGAVAINVRLLPQIEMASTYLHNLNIPFHPGKPGTQPKVPPGAA